VQESSSGEQAGAFLGILENGTFTAMQKTIIHTSMYASREEKERLRRAGNTYDAWRQQYSFRAAEKTRLVLHDLFSTTTKAIKESASEGVEVRLLAYHTHPEHTTSDLEELAFHEHGEQLLSMYEQEVHMGTFDHLVPLYGRLPTPGEALSYDISTKLSQPEDVSTFAGLTTMIICAEPLPSKAITDHLFVYRVDGQVPELLPMVRTQLSPDGNPQVERAFRVFKRAERKQDRREGAFRERMYDLPEYRNIELFTMTEDDRYPSRPFQERFHANLRRYVRSLRAQKSL
jgi:hypothetical protein